MTFKSLGYNVIFLNLWKIHTWQICVSAVQYCSCLFYAIK